VPGPTTDLATKHIGNRAHPAMSGSGALAVVRPRACRYRDRVLRLLLCALLSLLGLLTALGPGAAHASDSDPSGVAQRLESLRDRIGELGRRLTDKRRSRDQVATLLRQTELRIADLARETRQLEAALAEQQRRLAEVERDRSTRRDAAGAQREALARELREAWAASRRDRLRILLGQEDPGAIARVLVYADYAARARARRIEGLRAELETLEEVELRALEEALRVEGLLARRTTTGEALEAERAGREELVARLEEEIADRGVRLERLQADERELAEILLRVETDFEDLSVGPESEIDLSRALGQLPWPLTGRILEPFGAPRIDGQLRWQGVVIGAEPGAPVHSVFRGRVAYADWLRGFGLLIIVDHGGGYMSLYGQVESLLREPGDWVEAGEVVATAGSSGGQRTPGLYFEVRADGKPQDPTRWSSPRPGPGSVVTR
jgi:murein hydrolase activator